MRLAGLWALGCIAAVAAFSSPAAAEHLAWRVPAELTQLPLPEAEAARYSAADIQLTRYERENGDELRRILFADLSREGNLMTSSIGDLARNLAARIGAETCVTYSVSEIREFTIDGRPAADYTLICRGLVVNGQTVPDDINVRRTILVQGERRFYNLQADEYGPSLDEAASARSWDDMIRSLAWCATDRCNPR